METETDAFAGEKAGMLLPSFQSEAAISKLPRLAYV
jgi:hypothetical protein